MKVIPLLLGCLILGVPASARTAEFGTEIRSYFRHPDPQSVIDKFFALPPSAVGRSNLPLLMGAFFSHLIDRDPAIGDQMTERCRRADGTFVSAVRAALALSHHPRRPDLIRSLDGPEARKETIPPPIDLRTRPAIDATALDMLWVSFFATGEAVYVERIAEATEGFVGRDRLRDLIKSAKEDPQAMNPACIFQKNSLPLIRWKSSKNFSGTKRHKTRTANKSKTPFKSLT